MYYSQYLFSNLVTKNLGMLPNTVYNLKLRKSGEELIFFFGPHSNLKQLS